MLLLLLHAEGDRVSACPRSHGCLPIDDPVSHRRLQRQVAMVLSLSLAPPQDGCNNDKLVDRRGDNVARSLFSPLLAQLNCGCRALACAVDATWPSPKGLQFAPATSGYRIRASGATSKGALGHAILHEQPPSLSDRGAAATTKKRWSVAPPDVHLVKDFPPLGENGCAHLGHPEKKCTLAPCMCLARAKGETTSSAGQQCASRKSKRRGSRARSPL